jgi:hypothetical protein
MENVGRFCLTNDGAFDVKLQFVYYDEDGHRHHVGGTGLYPMSQTECHNPGDSGVTDGARVSLYAFVKLGDDKTASEVFVYEQGSPVTAHYKITGTTLINKLVFVGVG